jgi:hypothetical protein
MRFYQCPLAFELSVYRFAAGSLKLCQGSCHLHGSRGFSQRSEHMFLNKSCSCTTIQPLYRFDHFNSGQALNLIDPVTREKLVEAPDSDRIMEILRGGSVIWNERSPCLRHPENTAGCRHPVAVDLDTCPKRKNIILLVNAMLINLCDEDPTMKSINENCNPNYSPLRNLQG